MLLEISRLDAIVDYDKIYEISTDSFSFSVTRIERKQFLPSFEFCPETTLEKQPRIIVEEQGRLSLKLVKTS